MFFCWSLLSPHRSNSDIISCCFRFVKNFFQLFIFPFYLIFNKTEKEGFEPSRRFNTTYTLSRGASSASWVFLLNYFQSIWCLRLTAHFLLYSCVLWLSRTFFLYFSKDFFVWVWALAHERSRFALRALEPGNAYLRSSRNVRKQSLGPAAFYKKQESIADVLPVNQKEGYLAASLRFVFTITPKLCISWWWSAQSLCRIHEPSQDR